MNEETRVHTLTTTTKQQYITAPNIYVTDSSNININFNYNYLKTLPGLLKLIVVVNNFI